MRTERDDQTANRVQVDGSTGSLADGDERERGHAREWVTSILVGFALFLVLRTFAVEAFRIPTSSMEGTLLAGDFVLVNKAVYGTRLPFTSLRLPAFAKPERGDVVVFRPTHDSERDYFKRLIGLPGDTIEMNDTNLTVNGQSLAEPYARYTGRPDDHYPASAWQCGYTVHERGEPVCRPSRNTWGPLVVPAGRYLVLGDNRDDSEDSRYWGFVPREAIRGRPSRVYFSFARNSTGGSGWRTRIRWDRIGHAVE